MINNSKNTPDDIKKDEINSFPINFLKAIDIPVEKIQKELLEKFIKNDMISKEIDNIKESSKKIRAYWSSEENIKNFKKTNLNIPNGMVGRKYNFIVSREILEKYDITKIRWQLPKELEALSKAEENRLCGIPDINGEFEISLWFFVGEKGHSKEEYEKKIKLIINPDPKTLWKNIPTNKDDIFYKEDNNSDSGNMGEKRFIVSSKRGRSHQNNGSFRDDDYSYRFYDKNGWSLVAVSDGAGSAKFSREGSRISCNSVVNFFADSDKQKELLKLEKELIEYAKDNNEERRNKINTNSKKMLYEATKNVYHELGIKAEATKEKYPHFFDDKNKRISTDYFHATLIFILFKYFENLGYVIFSFSVGDCPIGLIKGDKTKLLNRLDVGEFGGGTRFITQNEIFHSPEMVNRFQMYIEEDFDFLFLMTDGIYDAKFEVEANLNSPEKWFLFLDDLKGNNDEKIAIDFSADIKKAEENLNSWMDFWSKGNHDDRTLFIIY